MHDQIIKKKKDFHSDEVQEVLLSFENMDNKEEFGGKGGVSVSSRSASVSMACFFHGNRYQRVRWRWLFWFLIEGKVKSSQLSPASPDHRHHCRLQTEEREGVVLLNSNDQPDKRKCHSQLNSK